MGSDAIASILTWCVTCRRNCPLALRVAVPSSIFIPTPCCQRHYTLYLASCFFFSSCPLSLLVSILHADIYHLLSLTRLLKYRHHQVHLYVSHIHCQFTFDSIFDLA